ncbi:hypothetical protein [Roseospira visakhapatnamensis]|uniref:Uncharacterized protein n=1 Tax=Roseospira visakhapatnamensis TaxID=390880 RepID=A0A7W6RCH4_9PROT|nr:hypothetical protein [Roseospira visakhapatnamensis]MBB4265875.1 hypothetical protein [Roseospira visakhapatnamensis]
MSLQDNKYVQAMQNDFDTLKKKWDELRGGSEAKPESGDAPGEGADDDGQSSKLMETAWQDFKEQSEKLQAAGGTASEELRGSYEAARDSFKRILDSYRKG